MTESKLKAPRVIDHQRDRVPALHARRDIKMARDAHAFVRGSTKSFYEWLETRTGKGFPDGPTVWICGDAHVGNLGPIARCNKQVEVELRDLDQTVRGNPAYDLVRLALSLAMAARSSNLAGVVTALLIEELMVGYLDGLAHPEEPAPASNSMAVRFVVREALRRKWRHLHRERVGKKPKFQLGGRFLPLDEKERSAVDAFLDKERVRRLVTQLNCRDDDAQIRVLDAAFWVKGCSSLGLWRCAALVDVVGQDQSSGGYSLLDLKQAIDPVAPVGDSHGVSADNGQRVVEGARALAPMLGERMLSGTVAGYSVFVRELMPQDLKLELEMFDEAEARATARALARIVGAAHSRQMSPEVRQSWRGDLERAHMATLDAPSWLWSSVVDLIGIHERAYLEHCRRYALHKEKQSQNTQSKRAD